MTTLTNLSPQDLPDWMRQARRGVDWGVLLIFAFSLIVAWPFLFQPSLPHTNASENYVYRADDYATAFQEGRLYPRWSANAFGGYGAPIPHYYPPAAAYTAGVIQVLFTNDAATAVRIIYAISFGVAGALVYVFVTRRTSAAAGILASFLYIYSPYVGWTTPHSLGDLPGVMTLALLPMLLWSVDRLLHLNRPLDIFLVTLITSGLLLTSVGSAVVSIGLVAALTAWHCWTVSRKARWGLALAGWVLGIGVASFYWIPAALEADAVQWRPPEIPSTLTLTFEDMITPLEQNDPAEMVPIAQLVLGSVNILFAVAGIISVLRFGSQCRFETFFLGLGGILITVALFILPSHVWLLGPIMLCLSVGSTAIIRWRGWLPERGQRLYLPILLTLVWITSPTLWLTPQTDETFGNTDAKAQIQHEQQGYGIAVLPPNAPIPSTIPDDLSPNRILIAGYLSDQINKLAPGQLSASLQAGILDHDTHQDRFQIRVEAATALDILTAYFPGWRATVSGRAIPLTQNPVTGLIRVVPPVVGNGELVVELGSTTIRTAAWIISGLCLLIVGVVTWGRFRRHQIAYYELEQVSKAEARLLTTLLICFGIPIYLLNQFTLPFSLRAEPGYRLEGSTYVQSRTDVGLSLLAFKLADNQYRAGDRLELALYWQAQRALSANYRVRLYLVNNRDSRIWGETDLQHPGHYPTQRWKTGLYVTDAYAMPLVNNMPPGNYQIAVEVNGCNPDCASGERVIFFNVNGQELGARLTLPTLVVVSL